MVMINMQFQELISLITNLNNIIKQLELSLPFCSIHKLDPVIISIESLKKLSLDENIWNINELIKTHCYLENKMLHIILTLPIFTQNTYPIYQFTPLPTYSNQNLIILNEQQNLYFYNNIHYLISNCVKVNKIYMCNTQYFKISNCQENIINKQKIDECDYHQLQIDNTFEQIQNT